MKPYLDESIEEELGLEFIDLSTDDLSDLDHDLACASDMLQKNPEDFLPPERVLRKELTPSQRAKINRLLLPQYAEQNRIEQEGLLEEIKIQESGERMVSVKDALRKAGIDVSYTETKFHFACGEYANKSRIWHAREQVVEKLISVFQVFNKIGIRPHLEDCFRPPQVQEGLLFRRIASLSQKYRDWDCEQVCDVGMSLTAPVPGLAGHQAGAALDMRLKDRRTGNFLNLGNEYAESEAICSISCPYVTLEQYETRMRFAQIMRMGDFRLLRTENWHVSFGDRGLGIDGPLHIREAVYGPIQSFDQKTGKITPYESDSVDRPYLSAAEMKRLVDTSIMYDYESDDYLRTQLEAVEQFRAWLLKRRKRLSLTSANKAALQQEDE